MNMNKFDLANLKEAIRDRNYSSCFFDNRVIGCGDSNIDTIDVDVAAFLGISKDKHNVGDVDA